ncbi:MAG TPA: hypothetical protein VJN92_20775 [Candidatus Acidoferrum sp.]|nr:hypothetical protein [Candidatus Acidoferrum sp.]
MTKYFSLFVGYSATPMDEPSPGFRLAASEIVANNPTIFPHSRYNASDLLNNKPDRDSLSQRHLFWCGHSAESHFVV